MISRRGLLALASLAPLAACTAAPAASPTPTAAPVVVYAPGALAAQTKALAAAYQAAGKGTVTFEVGHTPVQREQLAQGATPDVWIAASPTDLQVTAEKGLVDAAAIRQVGRTKLVVILAPNNPGKVGTLADLARPGVKLLVGAETLPIWAATDKALTKLDAAQGVGFRAGVLANIVSREMGVQPIVTKVGKGEADAGLVFVTDVPADRNGLTTLDIPDAVNQTLPLAVAPVTAGKNKAGATAFIEFLLSGAGRDVLTKAGYLPPA